MARGLLIVDAANVVGSVPDGWWRDRSAATSRLRDRLAPLAEHGLDLPDDAAPRWLAEPLDVVLVVEGAASGVPGVPGVHVVAASGSADDAIVALLRSSEPDERPRAVVTADRELRSRAAALGAYLLGPHSVR